MKENLQTNESNKLSKMDVVSKKKRHQMNDYSPQNKGKTERGIISIVMQYHPKQRRLLLQSLKSSASSTILTNQSRKVNHPRSREATLQASKILLGNLEYVNPSLYQKKH